jgi:hypothetical protein
VTGDTKIRLKRKRAARVVQHQAGVTAYPEPHAAPVVPDGWGPLDPEHEAAVLKACDEFPDGCSVRLGSAWETDSEYRVYRLHGSTFGEVCATTVFTNGRNTRLLAVSPSCEDAAQVALDFVNWDLEAAGTPWRLSLSSD